MKFLLLLNGPFGIGKSTIAIEITQSLQKIIVIDWDDINQWLFINDLHLKKKLRFEMLAKSTKVALSKNVSVIIPNTICDTFKINKLKQLAEDNNAKFLHVILFTDKNIVTARLNDRGVKGSIDYKSFEKTWEELVGLKGEAIVVDAGQQMSSVVKDVKACLAPS